MKDSFCLCIAILTAASTFPSIAGNWPGWRGPDANGISPEKNLPLKWSTNENVRWRVALPERGNSSPIVWGDHVFVTQAVGSENRRTIMCFERKTGKQLWQSGVTYAEREPTQRDNPYCAATPVTDGERVIASFGSAGLFCCDMLGKQLWHRELGKMNHMFGNASSPVLHGDLCYLYFGPDEKSRLIALNKRTGETVWEVQPPKLDPSELQQMTRGFAGAGGADGGPGGGGAGRGGGAGGRGGFGVGNNVAPQMFVQADKDKDKKVTKAEFTAVADLWFAKLDPEKTGKVTQDQFAERFYDAVPPRDEGDGQQQRRPSRTTGPAFFTAADADKDGSLTSAELKSTFAKWFDQWDADKAGSIDEDKLLEGLNAALPRGNFAGRGPGAGGGGGGQGGDRQGGRGGFGGPGGGGGGPGGSWSTPVLIKADGHEELIVNFPSRLAGLDPATGKQLWISKGVGGTIYTTPVWGDGVLLASSSGPGGASAIAVKAGGSGEISDSQRLWRLERAKSAIGSGVIYQGHVYSISQDGVAQCLEAKTGKVVWEERLKGPGTRSSSWSSMLLAGDKIYVPNQSGDVFVLRASPKYELLATNSVGEATNASLAASNGDLFLRTDKSLWCFTSTN
jgi:outer membrane protein assembly factor BamB